ncbi:MAG: general secretion pathway protein GspK [Myxococcota bacterium]
MKRMRTKRPPAPNQDPKAHRRGVALVMVLVITTIMGAVAADLENEAQVNLKAAANARDELQAHFHARSALELELFVLRFQSQVKDTLGQFIPIPLFELSPMLVSSDTLRTIFSEEDEDSLFDEDPFDIQEPFGDFQGQFFIEEVVDENRKIDINSDSLGVGCENLMHLMLGAIFDDPKYDILFENLGQSRDPVRNRLDIIAAMTDWADGNNTIDNVCILTNNSSPGTGIEQSNYTNLPYKARYEPKNGMFTSLAELRMVPGVNDAFMNIFGKYFTVWGSGTSGISINTAEPWMLKAVIRAVMSRPWVPADEERFEEFLLEKAVVTAVPGIELEEESFRNLVEAAGFPVDEEQYGQMTQRGAIRFGDVSSVYRITSVGVVNDASVTMTVVWRDNRAAGEIYYWRED